MKRFIVTSCVLIASFCALYASPPEWWSDTETQIIDPNATADNFAPANLGQLKNVAKQAEIHLDAYLANGAGAAINTLVSRFEPRTGQGYTTQQIAAFKAENLAPTNLGQLKAVAKPFYDRLIAVGYTSTYPWTTTTTDDDNYAIANVGQLKRVFAFDLSVDVDNGGEGNGLPDWWENHYGLSGINPQIDSDGDGVSNLQEFQQGTNPLDPENYLMPMIAKVLGDNQVGSPGNFLGKSLVVKVTASTGEALKSVNVIFQVASGTGLLTHEQRDGVLSNSLVTTIDSDGYAIANYKQPSSTGVPSSITAKVYAGTVTNQVTFTSTTVEPPPNDLFVNAATITNVNGITSGNNIGAAFETGEPDPLLGGASIWYRWTAPVTGFMEFRVMGDNFDTLCAVYSGTSVSNLTEVASNDDDLPADTTLTKSKVRFACFAGTTYQIAVDGFQGQNGDITLSWNSITGLTNDFFSTAQVVSGNDGGITATNIGASKEANEPPHGGKLGGASIWYQWNAAEAGNITFNTIGSNFNTLLSVYTGGNLPSLLQIASNNDRIYGQDTTSEVKFVAQAGTTYRIAVDGINGQTGNAILNWHLTGASANNLFANAQLLSGQNFSVTGNNDFATVESDEPSYNYFTPNASVWYAWTAPATGDYYFSAYGAEDYLVLAGYTGTSLANLVKLHDYPSNSIYFTATQGVTYFFSINSYDDNTGDFTFYCASFFGAASSFSTLDPQTIPGEYRDYANVQIASAAGNPQTNAADPECAEGIYYIVRSPKGWELLTLKFKGSDGPDHSEWWESTVAGLVAAQWAKQMKTTQRQLQLAIILLTYAFPRGRITKVGKKHNILNGEDFIPATEKLRNDIPLAFNLKEPFSWQFDDHERCQGSDKEEIRAILGLREDWKAVSF